MTTVRLPVDSVDPDFKFKCELEGTTYGFRFTWNDAAEGWFFAVTDDADNILFSGARVVVDFDLLGRHVSSALPPGVLYAVDTLAKGDDPGRNDLGARVQLFYDESV